jgi:hypothetical protein
MAMVSTHLSTDISTILESAGVEIFRIGDRELTGKCPVHIRTVGREDRSPSWSINAETGLWICFSCGARGSLLSLLYELIGIDAIGAQQFLIQSGMDRLTAPKSAPQQSVLNVEAFYKFERVPDKYCLARNLDPNIVYKFGVRWNPSNKSWAIPVVSPLGQLMGWQEKKKDWVRNYPVGISKGSTLFGIERFRGKTAVIVESPLDIVRFAGVFDSPQALASFGAHMTKVQMDLLLHLADKIVVAMDNDDAGIESSKKIYKLMGTPRKGIRWWNYKDVDCKDIGDMSDEEIERGLLEATVIPPWIV